MSLAILDQLQSPELAPEGALAGADVGLQDAGGFVGGAFADSQAALNLDTRDLEGAFTAAAEGIPKGDQSLPAAPFSADELQGQVSTRLESLSSLNADTLEQAIPANPGADAFRDLDITAEVNGVVGNLTSAITGNAGVGQFDLPAADPTNPFAEFQQFLTNAKALPSRLLDAILTVFKRFLDKLEDPNAWLSDLSGEALTEIFIEQIRDVQYQLPSAAIALMDTSLEQRQAVLDQCQTLIGTLDLKTLNRDRITSLRQQIKAWLVESQATHQRLDRGLTYLKVFDVDQYQAAVENLPNSSGSSRDDTLSQLFKGTEDFVKGLGDRIEEVTRELRAFTAKIREFIGQAIAKVQEIASQVIGTLRQQLENASQAINQVKRYLEQAIDQLKAFADKAFAKSDDLVRSLKSAFNKLSTQAVAGIEQVATTVETQVQSLRSTIANVKGQIDTQLKPEQLEQKLRDLLGKVTGVLESPAVQNALNQADQGIDQIVAALEKISLDPAFKLTLQKSLALEEDLKGINTAQLGTAQKAALKVGIKVIQEIDVPGTVNPELLNAFNQVLEPVVGLVNSLEAEVDRINTRISEFEPGTLVGNFLEPQIQKLVEQLNQYRPSVLASHVKRLYEKLLSQLDVLDPNQLITLLESLYQKLLAVIESLSPDQLVKFLQDQLNTITQTLDELPIERLVDRVAAALGDVEKLLGGLGLDSVLKSDFWHRLEEVLEIDLKRKIDQVDAIKAEVVQRVNGIDQAKIQIALAELRSAIATYAANPDTVLKTASSNLVTRLSAYQKQLQTFETQWTTHRQSWDAFSPDRSWQYDFDDLGKRLLALHDSLTAQGTTESAVSQVSGIVENDKTRLRSTGSSAANNKLKALSEASAKRSDEAILADFQQVIPAEIEAELTGPIKRILTELDRILAMPRGVLDDIKRVILDLRDAPGKIAATLQQVTRELGNLLREAVNQVKQVIQSVSSEVIQTINQVYQGLLTRLENLSPARFLNLFHDASDFKAQGVALLLAKLNAPQRDAVSAYLLAQLEPAQQTLLLSAGTTEAAQTLLRQAFNTVLQQPTFYVQVRLQELTLPPEAKALIDKLPRLEGNQGVRLNRLLLEAIYPDSLTLSVQSLFDFLRSKLKSLYPEALVQDLDALYEGIIEVIRSLPTVIARALNAEYQKVLAVRDLIQAAIREIFAALIARLRGLQGELTIGLEDVSDAYNRLLVALPL
ncbi:MAG TPA: hypothetical protein V6D06_00045 [Trichocoleus sp.]